MGLTSSAGKGVDCNMEQLVWEVMVATSTERTRGCETKLAGGKFCVKGGSLCTVLQHYRTFCHWIFQLLKFLWIPEVIMPIHARI